LIINAALIWCSASIANHRSAIFPPCQSFGKIDFLNTEFSTFGGAQFFDSDTCVPARAWPARVFHAGKRPCPAAASVRRITLAA
jgi:hypothetical protein